MARDGRGAGDNPLPLVRVVGPSMAPTLRGGDVVLVRFGGAVRAGDVVLVRWAARPAGLSIKRAVREVAGGWHVEGDNPFASTDSREWGAAEVVGTVRFRVWPRPRWLRRLPGG